MKRWQSTLFVLFAAVALAPSAACAQASTRERGIGPFNLETTRGPASVRLLKIDREMLWVDQRTSDGRFIEVGIPRAQIVKFDIPKLPIIEAARAAVTTQQIAQVEAPLKRIIDMLRPYRELPGMPVYDALAIQGRLLMTQNRNVEAMNVLNEVSTSAKDEEMKQDAKLRIALLYSRQGDTEKTLSILDNAAFPDDDPEFLDDLYAARAAARSASGRHKEAVMDYYYSVVFAPHINHAEQRSLLAALPDFASMDDWASAARAIEVLRDQYGDAEETKKAEDWAAQYEKQISMELAFRSAGQQSESSEQTESADEPKEESEDE